MIEEVPRRCQRRRRYEEEADEQLIPQQRGNVIAFTPLGAPPPLKVRRRLAFDETDCDGVGGGACPVARVDPFVACADSTISDGNGDGDDDWEIGDDDVFLENTIEDYDSDNEFEFNQAMNIMGSIVDLIERVLRVLSRNSRMLMMRRRN